MSFKLGGIVIEDLNRGLTAHEKLILVCYASFGLADGASIHPSQATIAKMAMCKPRMVRKALVKFEAARSRSSTGTFPKNRRTRRDFLGSPYRAKGTRMKTDKIVQGAEHLVSRAHQGGWSDYDRQCVENLLVEIYREEGEDDPEDAVGRFIKSNVKT